MAENGGSWLDWGDTWRRLQELQAEAFRMWMEAWGSTLSGALPGWRAPSAGRGEQERTAGEARFLYQEWTELMRDLTTRFGVPVSGVRPETFLRIQRTAEVYSDLYSLWTQMYEDYRRATGEEGEIDLEALHDLLEKWADRYRELVDQAFTPALPEPLQWVAQLYSGEIPLLAGGLMAHFWAPWAEFARSMSKRGLSLERPTPEAALKVYEEWRRAYEAS